MICPKCGKRGWIPKDDPSMVVHYQRPIRGIKVRTKLRVLKQAVFRKGCLLRATA